MRTITLFTLISLSLLTKAQLWNEVTVERDIFNRNFIDLLSFQDKDRILAVGGFGNIQSVFLSADGGNNFKYKFNITRDEWGPIQHLRFIDNDTLLLVTGNGILKKAMDPFHTPEFLIKYADYNSEYPSQGSVFFNFEKGDSAIVSSRSVFKTYDGGKSWKAATKDTNNTDGYRHTGTHLVNTKVLLYTNGSRLYKSSNYGNTWNSIFNFESFFKDWFIYTQDFSFVDDNMGYTIIGQDVYKTNDGGYSWDSISYFSHGGIACQDVKFFDENTGYSAHYGLEGLYRTKDGGVTWQEEFKFQEGFNRNKNLYYFGDSLFFVLNGRKIYKREKASLSVNKPSGNSTILSANIYPNPFTNSIKVELSSQKENVSQINIVDLQGRVLKTSFINEQNTTLNLSELATGIYFLRIENGNTILTKRIVKQ